MTPEKKKNIEESIHDLDLILKENIKNTIDNIETLNKEETGLTVRTENIENADKEVEANKKRDDKETEVAKPNKKIKNLFVDNKENKTIKSS